MATDLPVFYGWRDLFTYLPPWLACFARVGKKYCFREEFIVVFVGMFSCGSYCIPHHILYMYNTILLMYEISCLLLTLSFLEFIACLTLLFFFLFFYRWTFFYLPWLLPCWSWCVFLVFIQVYFVVCRYFLHVKFLALFYFYF